MIEQTAAFVVIFAAIFGIGIIMQVHFRQRDEGRLPGQRWNVHQQTLGGRGVKPPKCRSCGKEEWQHVCLGAAPPQALKGAVARNALTAKPSTKPAKPKAKRKARA